MAGRKLSRKPDKVTKQPSGVEKSGQQVHSQAKKKMRPQEAPKPRRKELRQRQQQPPHDEEPSAVQQEASQEVQPSLILQQSREEPAKECGTSETAETAETEADSIALEEAGTPRHDGAESELADTEASGEAIWMTWESVLEATGASKNHMTQIPQMDPAGANPSNSPCQYIPVLVKVDPSAEDLDPSVYVKVQVHPELDVFTPKHLLPESGEGDAILDLIK